MDVMCVTLRHTGTASGTCSKWGGPEGRPLPLHPLLAVFCRSRRGQGVRMSDLRHIDAMSHSASKAHLYKRPSQWGLEPGVPLYSTRSPVSQTGVFPDPYGAPWTSKRRYRVREVGCGGESLSPQAGPGDAVARPAGSAASIGASAGQAVGGGCEWAACPPTWRACPSRRASAGQAFGQALVRLSGCGSMEQHGEKRAEMDGHAAHGGEGNPSVHGGMAEVMALVREMSAMVQRIGEEVAATREDLEAVRASLPSPSELGPSAPRPRA